MGKLLVTESTSTSLLTFSSCLSLSHSLKGERYMETEKKLAVDDGGGTVATMAASATKDRMNGGVVLLGFDIVVKEYS